MKKKKLAILGATGSVGSQALEVAWHLGFDVDAISCRGNIEKAEEIIRKFGVRLCAVENREAASLLKAAVKDTGCSVIGGKEAASSVAEASESDTVLNSVTGIAGLMPTVTTLRSGKILALANKESLVTAGAYVMELAGKNNREIIPVDSEHCAVHQSLKCGKKNEVKKLLLTASGGPFFGYTPEMLSKVTASEALMHPTWSMGPKITVDSATLMNKGFEIIEAAWLFGIDAEKIDVIVHRESIIHSMVEYKDNMIIAQLGVPDMRSCIQYAFTEPDRDAGLASELDFVRLSKLTFYAPDTDTFPLLTLAKRVYEKGGCFGAALNGANEAAVEMFLRGEISLPELFGIVEKATFEAGNSDTAPEAVFEADKRARSYVRENAGRLGV